MTVIEFDDETYGEIVPGFIRKVLRNLIAKLNDIDAVDLKTELTEAEDDLIYDFAFGLFVQFEDTRGHQQGDFRYPAAVGFTVDRLDGKPVHTPEKLIATQKRTFLHGGLDSTLIRDVFDELRTS